MRSILYLILVILVTSCNNSENYIYYKYNGIVITRLDKGKETFFFYGYCNEQKLQRYEPSLEVDWSFDDYLDGFILFHDNGKVEIVNAGGGEYKVNNKGDSRIFLKNYNNHKLAMVLDPYYESKSYKNIYHLYSNIETEKKINKRSGVVAIYF